MKSETVRIYFLSAFSVYCHPNSLLPWQHDVTTSPLYRRYSKNLRVRTWFLRTQCYAKVCPLGVLYTRTFLV